MTDIIRASVTEANALYKAADYSGRAGPNDILLGIHKDQLICVARMMNYDDCYLVRHVCTLPEYRRQGHASELCKELIKVADKPVYLFPLPQLVEFYQSTGFTVCAASELPHSLASVWQQSKKKHAQSPPMLATAHVGKLDG